MANKFTRNITNITDIEKVPKYTNNENDLLSHKDGKKSYIRRKKDYHCLTDNIKTVDVKGATDLLTAEVDSENNNVVMTAKRDNTKQNKLSVKTGTPETVDISLKNDELKVDAKRDNTKQDKLSVKTDTPETVDISLEKDVLQVDVKKDDSGNELLYTEIKTMYITRKLESGSQSLSSLGKYSHGEVITYVKERQGSYLSPKPITNFTIKVNYTSFSHIFSEGFPFNIGINTDLSNHEKLFDEYFKKMELVGLKNVPVLFDFNVTYKTNDGIKKKEIYTDRTGGLSVMGENGEKEKDALDIMLHFSSQFSSFIDSLKTETNKVTHIHISNIRLLEE